MRVRGFLRLYEVFRELRMDPGEGVIKSKYGIRYLLFSDDMVLAIEDDLRRVVGREMARGLTYRIGFEAGVRFAKSVKEQFRGEESFQLARRCAEFAQTAGWGKHRIAGSLEEGESTIIVYNSPLSRLRGGEREPVCSFHSGLLAGSMTFIIGERVVCREVNCVARGDDFCKFVLRPETREWGGGV